jgi:endonuclease G, mitochondrial
MEICRILKVSFSRLASRLLTRYDGETYVVTGPMFIGKRGRIGGRVEVPNYVWKAAYDPQRDAGAYITRNAPGNEYGCCSVAG